MQIKVFETFQPWGQKLDESGLDEMNLFMKNNDIIDVIISKYYDSSGQATEYTVKYKEIKRL